MWSRRTVDQTDTMDEAKRAHWDSTYLDRYMLYGRRRKWGFTRGRKSKDKK